ncbi:hypothetical protein Jden_0061 [Jonesia denitrificans DSM 20603]|uniref:Uncharacterized protein n=1 Tax=Jonesia denitrificans (strain ATCC 14870 / DSM 20603 / BCRC 15368 / CIP 55.134 / JCM 11481 / NBRC 15587 / NCTC 10816 / Prevot 55134) TaxID=471856 RepID=C7R559_JONDD|nr:hypothetical protein Jden_0061 [Jonesia denitrificans DSM 20603]ASE08543.1 hypothetical protein CEP80_04905 [Jonesia denitrificans]SQH19709.1 Uncharacterised protein [Jonesia denitrificans]
MHKNLNLVQRMRVAWPSYLRQLLSGMWAVPRIARLAAHVDHFECAWTTILQINACKMVLTAMGQEGLRAG